MKSDENTSALRSLFVLFFMPAYVSQKMNMILWDHSISFQRSTAEVMLDTYLQTAYYLRCNRKEKETSVYLSR